MKTQLDDGSVITYAAIRKMVLKPDRVSGGVETAEGELHRKTLLLAAETGRTYSAAMTTVLGLDDSLKRRWVRETLRPRRK